VSHVLDDWRGVDRGRAAAYIQASISYEYGLGQGPGLEAHGGSTYCGVAALALMGRLETALTPAQSEGLVRWLVARQAGGFQGRPGKPADACYSFWIGAALHLLGAYRYIDGDDNAAFINACQFAPGGGIAKYPDHYPDILHTYLGICGMALMDAPARGLGLKPVHAALNVSREVAARLPHIHIAAT
jgi:geranylgeranyl transferase type-1 subunit beta